MTGIPDFDLFRDAKGRRCIAYNCGCDHCLVVGDDGSQTFTLKMGDTNSAPIDAGQPKVRTMAAPNDRNPGGSGLLPIGVPVFFEGELLIGGNFERIGAWWFLFAQLQGVKVPASPPFCLQIESVKTAKGFMEYFRGNVARPDAPGGMKIDTVRMPVPRVTPDLDPSKARFKFRLEALDAAGGPDGFFRVIITLYGQRPKVICDYRGVTGFPGNPGLYPGWGIYGADRADETKPVIWTPKQLPLVFRFDALDWGVSVPSNH